MSEWIERLEERLSYHFKDRSLLIAAMTHSSYANEHKKEKAVDNERLEFLGDAVLEAVSSEFLYHRHPDKGEGWLSKTRASMVCEPSLAKCARDLGLPGCLRMGKGEEMMGGRKKDSLISDSMEALIGAVFLDGGFYEARRIIRDCVLLDLRAEDLFRDAKSTLQELVDISGTAVTYELIGEAGPDHDKLFTMAAVIEGRRMGIGSGRTKKAAAQMAADRTIEMLKRGGSPAAQAISLTSIHDGNADECT